MREQKVVDPAENLKPQKEFRKANHATSSQLWTNENEFGLYDNKELNKHEMCKLRSRERYFQSSISTLPGPEKGVNCVKTRARDQRASSEADHLQRKKGHTFDNVFASHIDTLPGTHTSSKFTQKEIEA